jgi:hypothetical protein
MNKILAALIATAFTAGAYAADTKPAAAASAPKTAAAKPATAASAPKAAAAKPAADGKAASAPGMKK